ncbi:uncharacterized protein LOC126673462 [Mercurialis annua]|uniref:uncharacterized protein LOC126673462 n=1 Tax=Mercurialis annua TaxID=3986 RepID=UPI002160CA05|nr:uncharacterized protein LOC126673462 [Mercurialis annua]
MNFTTEVRLEPPATGAPSKLKEEGYVIRRRKALRRVDRELSKGNFKNALSLVKQLKGKPFGLRGFGAAKQVPKNGSALDKFEFDGVNLSPFRALVNSVMDSIENHAQFSLEDDDSREYSCEEDHFLCLQHEAGHFLVGYLLGALPKAYRVPSMEELRYGEFAGAKVEFLGFEFLREVGAAQMLRKNNTNEEACSKGSRGKISSKTLNHFSCIILGGLVVEHLVFGHSRGHYYDVDKLNSTFEWLNLPDVDASFQVRWAAINTIFVLNRHHKARSKLAETMSTGQSIGYCIEAIENAIDENEI